LARGSLDVSFQAFFCKDIFVVKRLPFDWLETVLLAVQIAILALVGVTIWLMVFEL
jgi:hypothetical protein